jgi:hypothetical protein
MVRPLCSDDDFVKLFLALGPKGTSQVLRCTVRAVFARREALEARRGIKLESPIGPGNVQKNAPGRGKHRIEWTIKDGYVLIGGDAHVWPGQEPTAMRAFVKFAKKLAPKAIILNGDIFDGASISRHARIMWEQSPTVQQELEAAHEWLNKLVLAAPTNTLMAWPEGNHDARFETKLSERVPEYASVKGVHLKDHFSSRLIPCWDVWINNSIVVQHRGNSGGENASLNNTIKSGKTFISNHLHSAQVRPFTDLNGTRWGVDTGCLADPWGPQFRAYTENRYRNHRAGFCVLKLIDGELMEPQLVLVWDEDHVQWRGDLIRV